MKLNQPINRAGAKPSAERQSIMHEARDHATQAAHRICASCGCSDCADVQGRLEGAPSFEPSDSMAFDKSQTADIERGNAESVLDILNRLQSRGLLSSQQAQMAAAAIAIRPMYNNAAH
jgi:hypothetical protein